MHVRLAMVCLVAGFSATAPAPSLAQGQAASDAEPPERHADWEVLCKESAEPCVARQEQASETGERLLLVEIAGGPDGAMSFTALLPFGLLLENGVMFQVDGREPSRARPFRTCIPAGCLVAFDVDDAMRSDLENGMTLSIGVSTVTQGDVLLPVSLAGFTAATARLTAARSR